MARMAATAAVGLAALLISSCGAKTPAQSVTAASPATMADGFNPAGFDLNRPCTLLRPQDAEQIGNQPLYRTIAADRVEENHIRCAYAVGDGGLNAMVEAEFVVPADDASAELAYVSMCRAQAPGSEPRPTVVAENATAAATPAPQPPPAVPGRACRLANGGYALLMSDRVLVATVRDSSGAVSLADTQRLAAMLGRRLGHFG